MHLREAWRRKYTSQSKPWSGPVHAAPLLRELPRPVVELGAGGGKVGDVLPPDTLALDWVREGIPAGRPALVADAARLPFRDEAVGSLVAIHVLGHLLEAERHAAAAEWRRVLRPGGELVVEAFATGDARAGVGTQVEPLTWVREGIATHHFEMDELRALFSAFTGDILLEERQARWGKRRVLRARLMRAREDGSRESC